MKKSPDRAAMIFHNIDYTLMRSIIDSPPNIMNEKFTLGCYSLCARTLNFATQLTADVMLKLVPTGIPQHFFNYMMEFEFRPLKAPPKELIVLSVKDLEFGFVVWLIACAISIFAFTLELIWYLLTVKITKIIKDFIALIWLLKFIVCILRISL